MCRRWRCRGSIGWMGAPFATPAMFRPAADQRKKTAEFAIAKGRIPAGTRPVRAPEGSARLLVVATAALEIAHLVQPAFPFLRFADHPLPLLDQLADLLPALVPDLRVELRTARGTDGLAALLADLLVELVPALRLDGLTALATNLLVERAAALPGDFHAALSPGLCNGHSALLLLRHFPCLRWFGRNPPPLRLRLLRFQEAPLQDALLALLDELTDLLAALASDLFVERGAVLVADGLTALSPPELAALAADLLVELHAPFVADALAALAAGFGDGHAAFSVAAGLDHLGFLSRSYSCAGSGTTSPPGAGLL